MMAARRLSRAHHEFRFGRRELAVLGAVFCLIASLVFVAGVVVGREMSRSKARAEVPRESRLDGGGRAARGRHRQDGGQAGRGEGHVLPHADRADAGPPAGREAHGRGADGSEGRAGADSRCRRCSRCRRAGGAARRRARSVADRAGGAPRRPRAQDAEGADGRPDAAHPPPRATRPARVGAPQPARPPAQVAAASGHVRARGVDRAGERLPEPGSGRGAPRAAGGAGVRRLRLSLAHRGRPTALPRPGRSVSGAE